MEGNFKESIQRVDRVYIYVQYMYIVYMYMYK